MPNAFRTILDSGPLLFVRKNPAIEQPLRSELFNPEQMQNYGKTLSESHRLSSSGARFDSLLGRLEENETVLEEAHILLMEAVAAKERIVPAADWILDNFYLVQDHIRTSKRDLPKGFSKELPRLEGSSPPGLPRVYDIALERISHGDGLVDPETLQGFFDAYQSVNVLTLGELWAFPIMLRLALIENLRRISIRISTEIGIQRKAASWADRLIARAVSDPKSLILLIADIARSEPPLVSSFVAELSYKLQGKGASLALALTWMEQQLAEKGESIDSLVQSEMQQQAADQVSVSNTIRSLRSLTAKDWKQFVESTSEVEKTLMKDPACCYQSMEFSTRDRYRHVVENTAKLNRTSEAMIAGYALDLARECCGNAGCDDRASHVGYYLIDKGFSRLELKITDKRTVLSKVRAFAEQNAFPLYGGVVSFLSFSLSALFVLEACHEGTAPGWLSFLAVVALVSTTGLSVTLVNWAVMLFGKPSELPRMDYAEGIPPASRTLVAIPSMFSCRSHIDGLLEALEVRFLANRDDNLFFGLLTDYSDAKQKVMPEDAALLSYAMEKTEELNERYRSKKHTPFFLFHRERLWNDRERTWMGYERKRGKLAALNELILFGKRDNFERITGNTSQLSGIVYVITLDTDTFLPRDAARRMVGVISHPLNKPVFDASLGRVVEGYGILQPRVASSLEGASRSRYAWLNSSDPGLDPYTRSTSDVYQDLFGEGSFVGKGIYDVASFELALDDRLPENKILSHDLLEGCYTRSGLLSDVQLIEAAPFSYHADVQRRRRWMRGDWQLFPWLLPSVPSKKGVRVKNPVSALGKWKILDNLRRSVASIALTLFLLLSWTVLPASLLWTAAVTLIMLLPAFIASATGFFRKPKDMPPVPHVLSAFRSSVLQLAPAFFNLACLPYDAYFSLRTIAVVHWRIAVSRRKLLEWRSSDAVDGNDMGIFAYSLKLMWFAPVFSLSLSVFFLLTDPSTFLIALPFLALWFVSPAIACWMGKPVPERLDSLTDGQNAFIRGLARKTWAFFETFVTAEENWLPPDNFQEVPAGKIAHRTSPTNMGLALLANLTAFDFGYLTMRSMLGRTERTLDSMSSLERHHDHFYNWYDTITKKPLMPRYVSTVDSGNLSAHFMTLRAGLLAMREGPHTNPRLWEGLHDTATVLEGLFEHKKPVALAGFAKELDDTVLSSPVTIASVRSALTRLFSHAEKILLASNREKDGRIAWWAEALLGQCRESIEEMDYLFPWITSESPCPDDVDFPALDGMESLLGLQRMESVAMENLASRPEGNIPDAEKKNIDNLLRSIAEGRTHAGERLALIDDLSDRIERLSTMDYAFLFDKRRRLFSIGYNADSRRRDAGYYDLLASEARLAIFISIARGHIPQESWFSLGRLLTENSGELIMFSWSGSMFEYLMPLLVMPLYGKTLLYQSCVSAVKAQIEYGNRRGIPWGISESGYNSFDASLNYQYHAFGVPCLGLQRGLVDDLVIAPYATALALMVLPGKACANLERLSEEGFEGDYGLYEAVDYTKSRVPAGHKSAVVRSFMAHHQGMSLLAFAASLFDHPMQRRFSSIPEVQATALLLEEKIPGSSVTRMHATETNGYVTAEKTASAPARILKNCDTPFPAVQLLSNGKYHVMVTNAGGGYSRWKDLSVTRWKEDSTRDDMGTFIYLRDSATGDLWSTAYQPTLKKCERYETIFTEGRAEFRRRDHEIETYTEIVVSPEDDIELRRVRITNRSRTARTIEVTSYAEAVIATGASDAAHPPFSNLFVQTEILEDKQAIICNRRCRTAEEHFPWMVHLMAVRDRIESEISFETDRMRFIGRGYSAANPVALQSGEKLSGTQGSVLDPIVAIRHKITFAPEASVVIDMITGISDSREGALQLVEKYQGKRFANRAFELSQTHSQIVLQQINGTEADANLYSKLAGAILYSDARMRTDSNTIASNRRSQSGLWGYSISGDVPIVLLMIKDPSRIELARQMVRAHAYWRQKGLDVDMVIWNEENGSYRQQLQEQLVSLLAVSGESNNIDRPGGIFIRSSEQISAEDRTLILAVSRIVISDDRGTLEDQIDGRRIERKIMPLLLPSRNFRLRAVSKSLEKRHLLFFNGHGGFSADGKEYVMTTTDTNRTPAPWSNVIANPGFGTVVTESGSSYTWSENAHEFRLTPWNNDPVVDSGGEALYVRDEDSGRFWSPTPLPKKGEEPYVTRHGFGYSVFEHSEQGIRTELWIHVAIDAPVKFMTLKITNESGRARRLSATAYAELTLGDLRTKTAMHIVTGVDPATGAIFANNHFNIEFGDRTVFFDASGDGRTLTADRTEFLGRNGNLANPDAMTRVDLSGLTGPALDPCAAIRIPFVLADGQEKEISFKLGAAASREEASALTEKFRDSGAPGIALTAAVEYWTREVSAIQVETPDEALNVLANGWLVYQILSCRLWGRSGFYQSGGAFGYRDQLQDAMSLVNVESDICREHILLCATRQFAEGDVQHWWHPPSGRGVRTKCSDDYLWLPLAVCRYVSLTGDEGILDEDIPYLEGREVNPDEESYYDMPRKSERHGTLYEHCVQAILRSAPRGVHGLPLIGSGDWNDGMNMVGAGGKGESVWLAFFLYSVLRDFGALAALRGDTAYAGYCRSESENLLSGIAENGWDGDWYRRAYFDDGSVLGSAKNDECRIDSIAQSWSVLSGAGSGERSRSAMRSLDEQLVRRDKNLVLLLDPPFDSSESDPGYIKGYVPGVRENGGQYTHAAIWAAMAFAAMGEKSKAWELFSMINPVNHSDTHAKAAVYKVEPYVMSADVYSVEPHTGRGGWTWYTGSAGWMYRLVTESLLGLRVADDTLRIEPCMPEEWPSFKIRYRYKKTFFDIEVSQISGNTGGASVTVDGRILDGSAIHLVDDRKPHFIEVRLVKGGMK